MGLQTDSRIKFETIHRRAVSEFFAAFEDICEGAVAVDENARIAWISEKYKVLLGIDPDVQVLGRDVEEIIPHSLMRQVVTTGQPILLDVMPFGQQWFVVTRLPLFDDGKLIGGVGFVLFDKLDYLKPLVSKFERLRQELDAVSQELCATRRAKYTISQFVGNSAAAMEVKRLARRAAQIDATILLIGETGTGKELLAQAIHAASGRAKGPFVGINVAAVPETLLEAEFFGVAPGAYTGANRKGREGKFKVADEGTLFLDEIGDMPLGLQAKLLRALQEQELEPLGSNRVIRVDTRVIAATSQDLKPLVDEGKFRADLYFRLNVLPIHVPPLRARLEDLDGLCEVMLERIAGRAGVAQRQLDAPALDVLAGHDWPGNVRELQNVLERCCLVTDRTTLGAEDLAPLLPPATLARGRVPGAFRVRPLPESMAELERAAIRAAMEATGGKKAAAAKLLGISRSTFYEKLAQHDLVSDYET